MPTHTSRTLRSSDSQDWAKRRRRKSGSLGGRRIAIRFPIGLLVRYRDGGATGWGKIVNISSRSVLFTTDSDLALNAGVEVYIKWPILLENSVQIKLIASGKIIGIAPGQAELAIEKHEFRTCGPSFFQLPQPCQMPDRAERTRYSPSKSRVANLQIPHPEKPGEETSNARWERVFQEKFADPEYYRSRRLSHSSPI